MKAIFARQTDIAKQYRCGVDEQGHAIINEEYCVGMCITAIDVIGTYTQW